MTPRQLRPAIVLFALTVSVTLGQGSQMKTFNFDNDKLGEPPAGFEFARTGQGAEGQWIVRAQKDSPNNHVLVQESADPTDYRFPLAVVKEGTYKDATLSVRARPVSGKVDQGFGMVWRYKDAGNYYITRCNADEDNCTIYHTVDGRRIGEGKRGPTVERLQGLYQDLVRRDVADRAAKR